MHQEKLEELSARRHGVVSDWVIWRLSEFKSRTALFGLQIA